MKKGIFLLVILFVLFTSCRQPHTCVCSTLQPNLQPDTNIIFIDNNKIKAFSICNSMSLQIVNTSTTTCFIKE